jgi:SWI/SNF-related matrix-associated actin-dependent regulator of chromatin subfamily A member 5
VFSRSDHQRYLSKIEEGEKEMRKQDEIRRMLTDRISQYRNPLQELEIQYPQNRGKNFTEDEDRYLVGYGAFRRVSFDL